MVIKAAIQPTSSSSNEAREKAASKGIQALNGVFPHRSNNVTIEKMSNMLFEVILKGFQPLLCTTQG